MPNATSTPSMPSSDVPDISPMKASVTVARWSRRPRSAGSAERGSRRGPHPLDGLFAQQRRSRQGLGDAELGANALRELAEARPCGRGDHRSVGRLRDLQRILLQAVDLHLEMEVRPSGPAGLADRADDRTLLDTLARDDVDAAEVRIHRRALARVLDVDDVAIAVLPTGEFDDAVADGAHRRSR